MTYDGVKEIINLFRQALPSGEIGVIMRNQLD